MNEARQGAAYDAFAAGYRRTKEAPLRRYVEAFTFMQMLGNPDGQAVLDLACGEGYYTRRIARAGARRVTGIDISAEMIALAKTDERAAPLGIEYRVADAAAGELPTGFDIVSAAYLLHYAPDVGVLEAMCRNIARSLRPGGRLVAINENPEQPDADDPAYTAYGFSKRFARPRRDGSRIEYLMVSGREMIRFDVWYYTRETYERVLRAAGFGAIRWRPLELSQAGVEACGQEYWQAYMANPPVIGLEAQLT